MTAVRRQTTAFTVFLSFPGEKCTQKPSQQLDREVELVQHTSMMDWTVRCMSIHHSCVKQKEQIPEAASLRSSVDTVVTSPLVKLVDAAHARSVLCYQPRTVYLLDGSILLSSLYHSSICGSKCTRHQMNIVLCPSTVHTRCSLACSTLFHHAPFWLSFCKKWQFFTIWMNCCSGIYLLCFEVLHQAGWFEEVVKCDTNFFELELLTRPFHHTFTKPDFN